MKPANRAPAFACLYHGLCDIARAHGYALAIHGSVVTDLDLIAIPWVDTAVDAEVLVQVLIDRIGACGYGDLLRREGCPNEVVNEIESRIPNYRDGCEAKPHGRRAWNLYLDAGARVDLSVMPRRADWVVRNTPTEKKSPEGYAPFKLDL